MRSPISSYPLRFMASGFIRAPHYPLAIHLASRTVPPHNTHPPLHARPSRIYLLLLTNTCALLWYTKWCRRSRLVRRILVDSILSHSSAYILGCSCTYLGFSKATVPPPTSPGMLTVEQSIASCPAHNRMLNLYFLGNTYCLSLASLTHQPHCSHSPNLSTPHYQYCRCWDCCYFLQTHRSSSIVRKLKVNLLQGRSS